MDQNYLNLIAGNVKGPVVGRCVNWFGNELDWTKIPYQQIDDTPWGATPCGCYEQVKMYGDYSCAVETADGERISCDGDCKDGACV